MYKYVVGAGRVLLLRCMRRVLLRLVLLLPMMMLMHVCVVDVGVAVGAVVVDVVIPVVAAHYEYVDVVDDDVTVVVVCVADGVVCYVADGVDDDGVVDVYEVCVWCGGYGCGCCV